MTKQLKRACLQSLWRHDPSFMSGWLKPGELLLMLTLLLFVNTQLQAKEPLLNDSSMRDPMSHFFNQSFNNLEEELEVAIEEGKIGVFIMFSDKDCPWCAKMKSGILSRTDVQQYYRRYFRVLTINIRGDTEMTDFKGEEMYEKDFAFKQHRVRATPVFMFFDTKGNKTMRLTGIVRNAEEFIWLGEFVVNGDYRKTNFNKYKRQRALQKKVVSTQR